MNERSPRGDRVSSPIEYLQNLSPNCAVEPEPRPRWPGLVLAREVHWSVQDFRQLQDNERDHSRPLLRFSQKSLPQ